MIYVLLAIETILLIAATCIIVAAFAVLFHWKQVLPFVPTGRAHTKRMIQELGIQKHERVIDIGAGWGTLVFPSAKYAKHVTGIEKSFLLAYMCKIRRLFSRNRKRITIIHGDAFKHSYDNYDVIMGWWIPPFIKKLQPKLEQETPAHIRIGSYMFQFTPSQIWKEELISSKKDKIFIYTRRM